MGVTTAILISVAATSIALTVAYCLFLLLRWISAVGGKTALYRRALVYLYCYAVLAVTTAGLTLFHNPFWWLAFCMFAVLCGIHGDVMRKHRQAIMVKNKDSGE